MPASRHARFSLAVLTTPFIADPTSARAQQIREMQSVGGAEKLHDIPSSEVAEMEYLPNTEAVRKWGSDVKGSVIVITRRR
jgi:hypothetical protein